MAEQLDNAINSLSEQAKWINICLYYTSNDIDKAKKMVANSYQDMYIIKGRFSSSSMYGAFIIFFNFVYFRLVDSSYVITPDYAISSLNTAQDWRSFEKEIVEARKNITDHRFATDFKDKIDKAFSISFGKEIVKLVEKNDYIQLNHLFQKFIQETSGLQRIEISVDLQKTTSLDMELNSSTTRKLDEKILAESNKQKSEDAAAAAKKPADDPDAEPAVGKNGVKLIVKGTLILSPIKGKPISNLQSGDRVMVTLIEPGEQTVQIVRAFKAYDEEKKQVKPIPARIVKVYDQGEGGYKIYAVIAKGILTQIIEEESNIKVALDPAYLATVRTEEPEKSGGNTIIMIVALIIIITVLVVVTVFAIL